MCHLPYHTQEIGDSEAFGWEARGCATHLAQKAARAIAGMAHDSSSTPLSRQSSAASSAHDAIASEAAARNDEAAKQAATEARKARAKARQVGWLSSEVSVDDVDASAAFK